MANKVDESMTDAARSDDEGCVTEEFSESRGSSETKEEEVDESCSIIRCKEPSCQASKKFDTILKVSKINSIHKIYNIHLSK